MSVIAEIRQDREDLARVLKKHSGIRKIVEELYPDSAHFIYELLQNAEDTGADEVKFILSKTTLLFEHNGRPFDKADILAITDIGEGTKEHDEEKIGRFGVGFKAVFAYTETPRIWSPTFSFEISDLVLPKEMGRDPTLGKCTRFEFPFNNPKKPARDAFSEIAAGLNEISEATLLFLSNIKSIAWKIENSRETRVQRIAHAKYHIEIVKQIGGKITESSHFLRFTHPVDGLEQQHVAIAFELDKLPTVKDFDAGQSLAKQFRIIPASPGHVAVFFNAEKETSGLRFHLHAPFIPELSRASIKDPSVNDPLFYQLSALTVRALFVIRDLGLLNTNFLAVLPNSCDDIPDRYDCIHKSIVNAMNEQALTPTYDKGHAPAKELLQAKASLKSLLDTNDLKFLVDNDEAASAWAIGATQKNSDVDRFLSGLAITDWDIDQFVEALEERLSMGGRFDNDTFEWVEGPDAGFIDWLQSKTDEWHQRLYALLYKELDPDDELDRLNNICIVRLSTGEYVPGDQCYFPTEDTQDDPVLPRVAVGTYTSGKGKAARRSAKKFLEAIGVREVGEFEQIEAILKERYSEEGDIPDNKTYKRDLQRFICLVEEDSGAASLFGDYWIFEGSDGRWYRPDGIYLDVPYVETGLHLYYRSLEDDADHAALSGRYENLGISKKKIVSFAKSVGAITQLEIVEDDCRNNPEWSYLRNVPGDRYTSPINSDYLIPGLDRLLSSPTLETARLLWRTMCNIPAYPDRLKATYRKNQANGSRYADSLLVHQLKEARWVPQANGSFVRPAEASRELLPDGFPFDPGWRWIKAIRFGEESARRLEEHRRRREVAKELGFEDDEALNDAKWFAELSSDERRQLKMEYERYRVHDLPDCEPSNPERRTTKVGEQAEDAPERISEKRTRSVSVGREAVKKDTDPYLRQQYTNGEEVMICQVCKKSLPFKLDDGRYYYEAVEFLPVLRKRHYQNYLALCPNHAAMYQHANGVADLMKELFLELVGNELEVVLGNEDMSIYFTKTHIADLRAVIAADESEKTD